MDAERRESELAPYAGRWVALAGGRVVGVGDTQREAYLAAKSCRPKEEPINVTFVPGDAGPEGETACDLGRLFAADTLAGKARQVLLQGAPVAYLVGGSVRDFLLGRESHDWDFAVPANALALGRRIADALGAAFYPLDAERGTARVVIREAAGGRAFVDIATLYGGDIESDLAARDFTLNALAIDLRELRLIDPMGGRRDLAERRLRLVSDHALIDDPIRAVRAVRLAAELALSIEPATEEILARDGRLLTQTSPERIRDEVARIMALPAAAPLRRLERLGLLSHFWPELPALRAVTQSPPHRLNVWEHTLLTVSRLEALLAGVLGELPSAASQALEGLQDWLPALRRRLEQPLSEARPRWLALKLAALLHDVGKPAAQKDEEGRMRFFGHEALGSELAGEMLSRLRFSAAESEYVRSVVRHHMRPAALARAGVSAVAAHRYYRDAAAVGLDIPLLSLADAWALAPGAALPAQWPALVEVCSALWRYRLAQDSPEQRPALVSGRDLLACGVPAGPQVGRWLRLIREQQVSGALQTKEDALRWVREALESQKRV